MTRTTCRAHKIPTFYEARTKSVLLWYSPREMYALVTGFEDYPKFCLGAIAPRWFKLMKMVLPRGCISVLPG